MEIGDNNHMENTPMERKDLNRLEISILVFSAFQLCINLSGAIYYIFKFMTLHSAPSSGEQLSFFKIGETVMLISILILVLGFALITARIQIFVSLFKYLHLSQAVAILLHILVYFIYYKEFFDEGDELLNGEYKSNLSLQIDMSQLPPKSPYLNSLLSLLGSSNLITGIVIYIHVRMLLNCYNRNENIKAEVVQDSCGMNDQEINNAVVI